MAREARPERGGEDIPAADYTSGMFEEGGNRSRHEEKTRNAPEYDRAAHRVATEDSASALEIRPDRIPASQPVSSDALQEAHRAARDMDERSQPQPEGRKANPAMPTPRDTSHSRDGTEAAGLYDAEDGPIGGTEEELDDLEAGGTPVDRNPRMKD